MFARGATLGLCFLVPSVALAGGTIQLVPSPSTNPFNPCGSYSVDEVVTVNVMLSQSPSTDHFLRLVQLDFTDSSPELALPGSTTWTATTNHFAHLEDAGATAKRFSNTFHGDLTTPDLGLNTTDQFMLPGDGSAVKVAEFTVTLPSNPGNYLLDVMNATDPDADHGAQVRFGYSLTGTETITAWKANATAPNDLTGGTLTFNVGEQAVLSSTPADGTSLPGVKSNVIRLQFDRSVGMDGPISLTNLVQIRELTPNCGLGTTDLAGDFSFALTDGGTVLRVTEVSGTGALTHQTWYAVVNVSWSAVAPFKMDFVSVMGDVDNSLFTDFGDVPALLGSIDTAADDTNRRADIDGSGFIDFGDVPALLGTIDTGAPPKPSGH